MRRVKEIKGLKCPSCKGERKVTVWNPYYNRYETKTCSRFNGIGRVSK